MAEPAENNLMIEFSQAKTQSSTTKEIKKSVCALLNTNGGKLVLKANDATVDNTINADKVIRPIEQYFKNIITVSEVHKKIKVVKREYDTIALRILGLSQLCTLSTNLFLPTNTEIPIIPATEQSDLQKILFRRRIVDITESEKQKVPEQFFSGCDCGMRESKSVQFKNLKADETKHKDLADRIINNSFTNIMSAFANAFGGCIFYGINDDGIVVGELLKSQDDKSVITKKLETAVQKMIWPESLGKIERGKQWDIKFVPVTNCGNNEIIPLTFIIVVSVLPCSGGVFTKEPESYYVENGKVKVMSFDTWKRNMFFKVPNPSSGVERGCWSSKENERKYMSQTQCLEKFRQLGNWKKIEIGFKRLNEQNDLTVNTKLVSLFQIVTVNYRQDKFEDAKEQLEKFRDTMLLAEDKSIFDVEERYSASAIERSRGEYKEAWNIIKDGLKLADNAPAGFVPASFYAHAASVFSNLVNDESFVGMSKDDKGFEEKVHEHVERAKNYCHKALQHLAYVEDDFEIAREELKQRISITLASLCLRSASTDNLPISSSDIDMAEAKICESEESLMKLKGTPRLKYNNCRLLLVKCDLYFRKYQLEQTDTGIEFLKESLRYVEEAEKLAKENSFEEIMRLCEPRKSQIQDKRQLEQANNNETKSNERIEDEW